MVNRFRQAGQAVYPVSQTQWRPSRAFDGRLRRSQVPLKALNGPYAFPRLAGVKLRGCNIVPRPSDTGNDDNDPDITPANFYDLLYDWGTNGPTDPAWTQWIKPQIDAVAAVGGNAIRFIFDPTVRVGDSSHHGAATWRGTITLGQLGDILDQIITYCASLGVYYYATAMEVAPMDQLAGTTEITQFITEFVNIVSDPAYHNVPGIDIVQEFDRSIYDDAVSMSLFMSTARAALQQKLPITSSIAIAPDWATHIPIAMKAGVDYLDLHHHMYSSGALWLNTASPNLFGKPVVIGECGCVYHGGYPPELGDAQESTHPYSSERRARHYQDMDAGLGRRADVQMLLQWGVTKEWPADNQDWGLYSDAQDGSYAFTTPRDEMVGPWQQIPTVVEAPTREHTLDLSGADTTIAAWSAASTYMLGWSQHDASNTFSRSSHRVKRVNGSLAPGVINFYGPPSIDESISVEFDASQAVASGGQIDWTVSVRHQGYSVTEILTASYTTYYFADIASKPGTPGTDGLLSIWKVVAGTPSLLASSDLVTSGNFDLTHTYRLTFSASGLWPTTLSATVRDLTASADLGTVNTEDSTPQLQHEGSCGMPAQIGEVYYTNVKYIQTADRGPAAPAPTIDSSTPTSLTVNWSAATGGVSPYRYILEYVVVDASGFPTTDWSRRPMTTGLTDTITGLDTVANRYGVRVLVVDHAGDLGRFSQT